MKFIQPLCLVGLIMSVAMFLFPFKMPGVYAESFNGFSVSDTIIDVKGKPGETVKARFTVFNDSTNTVKSVVDVRDFDLKDNQLIYKHDVPLNWSVTKWSTIDKESFSLKPKSSKDISLAVTIPEKAEQGEHRALIGLKFTPDTSGGSTKVATEILPVLYVLVTDKNGNVNVNKDWDMDKFTVDRFNGGAFYLGAQNNGNVHLESTGVITLKNALTGAEQKIEIPTVNLLPGARKDITVPWKTAESIGWYKASVKFSMDGERFEEKQVQLFMIPWGLAALAFFFIALLVLIFFLYKRHLKKRFLEEARRELLKEAGK